MFKLMDKKILLTIRINRNPVHPNVVRLKRVKPDSSNCQISNNRGLTVPKSYCLEDPNNTIQGAQWLSGRVLDSRPGARVRVSPAS